MQLKLKSKKLIKDWHLNIILIEIEIRVKLSRRKLQGNLKKLLKPMDAFLIPRKNKCMILGRSIMMEIKVQALEEWVGLTLLKCSKCSLEVVAVEWAEWVEWVEWEVIVVSEAVVEVIKAFHLDLHDCFVI